MSNCEKCRFRFIYERKPRSFVGRLWKWHIRWCPGWKAYERSLPREERERLQEKFR